jgi:hypothetical protein
MPSLSALNLAVALIIVGLVVWAGIMATQARSNSATCTGGGGAETDGLVVSTDCDDGNACTIDLKGTVAGTGGGAYCAHRYKAPTEACTSTCYDVDTATTCDGTGQCVADSAACKGMCRVVSAYYTIFFSDDCTRDLFPIRSYFFEPRYKFDFVYRFEPLFVDAYCYTQVCMLNTLQVVGAIEDECGSQVFSLAAGGLSACADMLDTVQTDVDLSCIMATEIPLDSQFVDAYINSKIAAVIVGEAHINFTARFCSFRYACARLNVSNWDDPLNHDNSDVFQTAAATAAIANATGSLFAGAPRTRQHRAVDDDDTAQARGWLHASLATVADSFVARKKRDT